MVKVMGIVNLTQDSFSDGGVAWDSDDALRHIERLIREGADWIDLGASSSKPGSQFQSPEEEIERLNRVLSRYFSYFKVPVSVDTVYAQVADYALNQGVKMINDISAMTFDPEMIRVVANHQVPVVLMHMQGTPDRMQNAPDYRDVVVEVKQFLMQRVAIAKEMGIIDIWVDPGLGFGKTVTHNLELLKNIDQFKALGCPILVGPSRKSFIGTLTGAAVADRMGGTVSACLKAVSRGATMVRVHDVGVVKQAIQVWEGLQ